MSVSLKQAILRTQWVPPDIAPLVPESARVLRQVFGYQRARDIGKLDIDDVSVQRQLRRLRRPHFNLNVISVGFDDLPTLTAAEADHRVDMALMRTRAIFDAAGIGIGRVLRFAVASGAGAGHDTEIDSRAEFRDLTNAWTVHRDGIDVFIVRSVNIEDDLDEAASAGISPVDGPCNKDDDSGATGIAVALQTSPRVTGDVLAHELGHYLGLPHEEEDTVNLMYPLQVGVRLTAAQADLMREHCMMRSPLVV